jgi:hypothetical protein
MIRHSKRAVLLGCIAFASALVTSGFTSNGGTANGGAFFQPAGAGKVDLVYFGFIKDTKGKLLNKAAVLRIDAQALEMDFQFMPDKPGHYRSPDIGLYHKEMGVPVDPSTMEITIAMPGYKQVRPLKSKVPNKTKGAINIDFVMEETR